MNSPEYLYIIGTCWNDFGRMLDAKFPADVRHQSLMIQPLFIFSIQHTCSTIRPALAMRWAIRHESVRHLDDLLLRRTRIGVVTRGGGADLLAQLRLVVQEELNWTDHQWDQEVARYLSHWKKMYGVPALK